MMVLTSLDICDVDLVWTWGTNVSPQELVRNNTRSIYIFIIKKLKFSAQSSRKTRHFEKKLVFETWQK